MNYQDLMYWHLSTVLPAALLGGLLLAFAKGTPVHRLLGKIYMMLMLLTAIITLFMSAEVGPTLLNHFGFIHLFSLFNLFSLITYAIWIGLHIFILKKTELILV